MKGIVSYPLKVVSELVEAGEARFRRAHDQRRGIGDAEAPPDWKEHRLDGVGKEEPRDDDGVEERGRPGARLRRQPRGQPGGHAGLGGAAAAHLGGRGRSHLQEWAGEGRGREGG